MALDLKTDSPTEEILTAIADLEGCDPATLPPLYDAIECDALDALLTSRSGARTRFDGSITFHYAGYQITATSDGDLHLIADIRY
jgi:hypothetical protein